MELVARVKFEQMRFYVLWKNNGLASKADNRSKAAIDTHAIGGKHIASSIIQLFRVISRHQRNTPGNAYLRQIIISWANRIRTERVNTHLLSSRQGGAGRS